MGTITAAVAAARAGVAVATWRSYVARGQAPAAEGFDPTTGLRVWDEDAVQRWLDSRPGAGARTDLEPTRRSSSRSGPN